MSTYQRKTDVTCNICGYSCGGTYMKIHIRNKHNLNSTEYLKMYPNAILVTKEYLDNMSVHGANTMNKLWKDDKYRIKMTKILKDNANNKDFKIRRAKAIRKNPVHHTERTKNILREKAIERWKDTTWKENTINSLKTTPKRFKSQATRTLISEKISNLWENGHYKNIHSNIGKGYLYKNRKGNIINVMSLQELITAYYLDLCNCNYIYGAGSIQKLKYKDFNGNTHVYIPDFQVGSLFIEVKPSGWEHNEEVYNKMLLVKQQNDVVITVYDDNALSDYMCRLDRYRFYNISNELEKENCLDFNNLLCRIGDVRSELFNEI